MEHKVEIGDEARERETAVLTPNWSHGKRVLKDFKKWKGDVIYVLERLPWHLVEGGWKWPDHR